MIRNQNNYLTSSVQENEGKERRTWSNGITIETVQPERQKDSLFHITGQTAIQNKYFTRTYMQRHTMTEIVKNSWSTTLKRFVKIVLLWLVKKKQKKKTKKKTWILCV